MSDQRKALSRSLFEQVIAGGNLERVAELFTADYQDHDPANEQDTFGHDGIRAEIAVYQAAFSDLRMDVQDQLAEGDEVVTRWQMTGTHTGELNGVPASGNRVTCPGITIHRFDGDRIAEGWWNWDTFGLMRQVGAIPAEEPVA